MSKKKSARIRRFFARRQRLAERQAQREQADVRRSIDQTFGAGHYDKMYGKKRAAKRP